MLRPLVAMLCASAAAATAGFQYASRADAPPMVHLVPIDAGMGFSEYDIRRLKILEPTLYHVEESYVEPGRIDWEKMFVAGMEAVERKVPSFLFDRNGDRVTLEIGEYRTVLEIEEVGSSRDLQQQMRQLVSLMKIHLEDEDIPRELPADGDAFAEVEYALVNGVLSTLDPHSMLLPPPDASQMDVENQGEFGGLGISVVEEGDRLVVDHPMPGTPAHEAGIHREDIITRIDGQSTINMGLDDAVDLLRGPVGSRMELEIMREGFEKPAIFALERQIIKLNEVEGVLLEGDVALIAIESFHKHVERELHEVLGRLTRESRQGLAGVVLDLRGNPGGYLNQAVAVADTFLREGDIVSTVDGYGGTRDLERARSHDRTQPAYPVAVLVDSGSASASEVVAGALRNNERAVIIGERSFGKGSVQSLHKFFDSSKLKLTISKYLTPGGRSIQAIGIPADIELVPVRVGRGEDDNALITRMYWREQLRREADLDQSLSKGLSDTESAYQLRFLEVPRDTDPYVLDGEDYQVKFARDVLLGATSSRRAEILADVATVVRTHEVRGDVAITGALEEEGVAWKSGRPWRGDALPVRARLEVEDGIQAGARSEVTVHVTNTTDQTLYRVGVVAQEHPVLAGREFLVGKLEPGQTKRASVFVTLVDGYPTEAGTVTLSVRDAGDEPLGTTEAEVWVRGRPLPAFAWTWKLDGEAKVGEKVGIELTVENTGRGVTGEAYARIRNQAGKDLDILTGTLRPGELRTLAGEACPKADVLSGCQVRLLSGASWTGRFEVELRSGDAWDLELSIGDDEAYDHGSIVGSGFYEYYEHTETLSLHEATGAVRRQPPRVVISRLPDPLVTTERVSLSGLVEDDTGLRHVLVFGGGDKLFAQGAVDGLRAIPFTADAPVELGQNTLTVVAQDIDGFTTTRSVVTTRRDPEQVTRATAPADD